MTLGAGCNPAPSVRSLSQKVKHALDHFQDQDQKGEESFTHPHSPFSCGGGAAHPPPDHGRDLSGSSPPVGIRQNVPLIFPAGVYSAPSAIILLKALRIPAIVTAAVGLPITTPVS